MAKLRKNTRRFMKDRMHELIFNIDEASCNYSKEPDCYEFVMRMSRILYLMNSYAKIFDVFEIEEFTSRLSWSYFSLNRGGDVPCDELLRLTGEARTYLFDMTEAATLEHAEAVSLYSSRAAKIARAIGQLNAPEERPQLVQGRAVLAVA